MLFSYASASRYSIIYDLVGFLPCTVMGEGDGKPQGSFVAVIPLGHCIAQGSCSLTVAAERPVGFVP